MASLITACAKLPKASGDSLEVRKYLPKEGDPGLKWPTHIAFGPGDFEIVTDLRNNRLVYREGSHGNWRVSPIEVKGPHSVVYNPADQLFYANDTENHRLIAFADLSKPGIVAKTDSMQGVKFDRIHDVVIDPETHWLYAINPNSGHVFRFKAIGKEESVLNLSTALGGYARSLTFTDGRLFAIGSKAGRIVEILDWEAGDVEVYQSPGKIPGHWGGGTWDTRGLLPNDLEFFDGHWYLSSYFARQYAPDADFDKNKFIRFKTLDHFVTGEWEDLSRLLPSDRVPYYLTVRDDSLFLCIFNHSVAGEGDAVLRLTKTSKHLTKYSDDGPD